MTHLWLLLYREWNVPRTCTTCVYVTAVLFSSFPTVLASALASTWWSLQSQPNQDVSGVTPFETSASICSPVYIIWSSFLSLQFLVQFSPLYPPLEKYNFDPEEEETERVWEQDQTKATRRRGSMNQLSKIRINSETEAISIGPTWLLTRSYVYIL